MIFQIRKQQKITLPVRKIITLTAVDGSGCRMQIPQFIMCRIGPGNKVVNGNIALCNLDPIVNLMEALKFRQKLQYFLTFSSFRS